MIRYFSGMASGMIPRGLLPSRRSYTPRGMARKFRFRPPGLKPTTKLGTLGPYRGRLGLGWVIAPIVVGVLLLGVGVFFLLR